MAPTLGNMGPLKMNGSIYKNTLTYGSPLSPESKGWKRRKEERREVIQRDRIAKEQGRGFFSMGRRTVLKQMGIT